MIFQEQIVLVQKPDPIDKQNLTIEDIARLAEVGRGTVSRVLNNHPSVSADTRARVQEVIDRLNYSPNFSARHMRTENSNLVGFITDEVITTPYAVDVIRGAQEALSAVGKMMLVVSAGYDSKTTQSSMELLYERRVEGIIYASMFHRAVKLPAQFPRMPIVLANCFDARGVLPSVVPDEVGGGYNATRALLEKGHRRIGFINLGEAEGTGMAPLPAAKGRLEGYRKALDEFSLPYDPELVVYTHQLPHYNIDLTRFLMQLPDPPTAIFCGNDRTAMGSYNALTTMGLRIPQDIAVIGFDNQLDIGIALMPNLTTVQLPHYEMGRWAVEYLLSVQDSAAPPVHHKIDCPLVWRDSV
jgi:LacI family transcriptional regulator